MSSSLSDLRILCGEAWASSITKQILKPELWQLTGLTLINSIHLFNLRYAYYYICCQLWYISCGVNVTIKQLITDKCYICMKIAIKENFHCLCHCKQLNVLSSNFPSGYSRHLNIILIFKYKRTEEKFFCILISHWNF